MKTIESVNQLCIHSAVPTWYLGKRSGGDKWHGPRLLPNQKGEEQGRREGEEGACWFGRVERGLGEGWFGKCWFEVVWEEEGLGAWGAGEVGLRELFFWERGGWVGGEPTNRATH